MRLWLLVLFFSLSCAKATLYNPQGEVKASCWSWGEASCSMVCEPIHIKDLEGKTIYYHTNTNCMSVKTGGLSDNGVKAVIEVILGFPAALAKALLPFY